MRCDNVGYCNEKICYVLEGKCETCTGTRPEQMCVEYEYGDMGCTNPQTDGYCGYHAINGDCWTVTDYGYYGCIGGTENLLECSGRECIIPI